MNKEKVIKKAYKLMKSVTPIKSDCGKLCNGECCKGDNTTGMLLFPGEEALFKDNRDYKVIKDADGKNLLVCSGKCDRQTRPLSCRIFPLVPVLVDNRIYVLDDPRAKGMCPLIYDEVYLDKKFESRVYKTGKLLLKNDDTRSFLQILTQEITDILSLQQNLFT